jgi:hypothetical protein
MRIVLLLFFGFLSVNAVAQSVTGSWYGKADVTIANDNNYLTELIIKQKGDEVEGLFGYYFRDGYKSVFVRGNYNAKTRQFVIKNIPVTYFRSKNIDGVDCFMDFYGTVIISKVRSTLKGIFTTDTKYRYTCPDITVNFILDEGEKNQQDSLIKNAVARKVWQPRGEDLIVTNTAAPAMQQPTDSTAEESPMMKLVEVFSKRKNVLAREVEVTSDSVRISFYDNGDVDQDSISVFLNNRPVVVDQELTAAALNIYIKLDSTLDVNEVSMYAQNLGRYPPNTALMVINDGKTRHEIYLSSSLTQNAVVRLRRKRS